MAGTQKSNELSFNEKVNEFVQKNRKALFIGLAALAVILIAFIITITVSENLAERAYTRIDEYMNGYDSLMYYEAYPEEITDPAYNQQEQFDLFMADLSAFAAKNRGYVSARAYSLLATVYEGKKNWTAAEQAWTSSAKAGAKTYLAPIALFNAAVAAEEQGKTATAIEYYNQVLDFGEAFPSPARAMFSIARLEESRNNRSGALDAYRSLVARWPNDSVWYNLAQSRIIVLTLTN